MWICKDCPDPALCGQCYDKLQQADLNPGVCSQSHEHLMIVSAKYDELEKHKQGLVKVGGDWVPFADWLSQVWKLWDLDKARQMQSSMIIIQRVYRAFLRRKILLRDDDPTSDDRKVSRSRAEQRRRAKLRRQQREEGSDSTD